MRILTTVVAVCLVLSCCLIAQADDESEAMAAFEEGKAFFKEGKHSDAADAFRKAHRLNPNWKLLYNIGQSEAAAKRYGLALEAFEAYLAGGGDDVPEDRQEYVQKEIQRFRGRVGILEVEAEAGAIIVVDGVERGEYPSVKRIPVTASVEHEVVAVSGEERAGPRLFRVTGNDTVTINLALPKADTPSEIEPEPTVTEEKVESEPTRGPTWTWGWVAVGTGGALLAGGAITGGVALGKNGDLEDKCEGGGCYSPEYDLLDSRDNLATASTVLLAVGGVVAATGVVLLIVSGSKEEEAPAVTLAPGPGGAILMGRF